MATWEQMANDNLLAAKALQKMGHHRSAVTRAYFAAYSAVTSELALVKGVKFTFEINPSHGELASLTLNHLPLKVFATHMRRNIKRSQGLLWKARVEADYVPHATIGPSETLIAMKEASFVFANTRAGRVKAQSNPS